MRLELRRRAQADLDDIRDYTVEHFGVVLAIAYLDALEQAFRRLLEYPELGAETGLRPKLRAFGVREHRVYYRIEGQTVVVARVLHKAMDVQRHL